MKKGFTLIELLVVVLIIGILSAVALPQYTKAVEKSRAAEAFVILKDMHQKSHLYALGGGVFPNGSCPSSPTYEDMGIEISGASLLKLAGIDMLCTKYWCYAHHSTDLEGGDCDAGWATAFRLNNANTNPSKDNVLYSIIIEPEGDFHCYIDNGDYCKMLNL
ncbi:MAG: prepilin-type N-terminal cleavage/methylation domain-containing protein [Elusimicrobiaceae bacterium]|nr:prepilin-type N-terminal cleavage/methylation domain-containing protein [Elusimicrobiaceae bacterium]